MRIRDLLEWPPKDFEADGTIHDCPSEGNGLRILSATFIPASEVATDPGHIIIQLQDPKTEEKCSTRIRVTGLSLGRRVADTLSLCAGLSLAEAGNHRIEE